MVRRRPAWRSAALAYRVGHRQNARGRARIGVSTLSCYRSFAVASQPVVLIVDDDAAYREVVADLCRDVRCRVLTAPSVGDALGILATTPTDVVLSDSMMPRASA